VARPSVHGGRLRRVHTLPFQGEILVREGDAIEAGDRWAVCMPVARVDARDVTALSGVPPVQVGEAVLVSVKAPVAAGTVLARGKGRLFGGGDWTARWDGELVHVSVLSGLAFFRETAVEAPLYSRLSGTVVAVSEGRHIAVEGEAVSVRCALGAGGTGFGRVVVASEEAGVQFPLNGPEGPWVVVVADTLQPTWIASLPEGKVSAVIAPSISADRYLELTGKWGASDGSPPALAAVPLVLTEGICESRMPPAVQRTFRDHSGRMACVVASSIPGEAEVLLIGRSPVLGSGSALRIASGDYMGAQATAVQEEAVMGRNATGVLAPQLRVRREEGGTMRVCLDNLESLE